MSTEAEGKGYGHKSKTERIVSGKTPDRATTGKHGQELKRNRVAGGNSGVISQEVGV